MAKIIEINNFSDDNLFENISISIEKNKFVTISGANSCGKTTLIRILNRDIITNSDIIVNDRNINDYTISEYTNLVQAVIPYEIVLEEELIDIIPKELIKKLRLKDFINKRKEELTDKELILIEIAIALSNNPKILLLDDVFTYLDKKEIEDVVKTIRTYKDLTTVLTTINLNDSLYTDYLYIIGDKKIKLKGEPLKVLEKDNIINKSGLNLPFMIDLSVKLKDYELLDSIELDKDRMVNKLWK